MRHCPPSVVCYCSLALLVAACTSPAVEKSAPVTPTAVPVPAAPVKATPEKKPTNQPPQSDKKTPSEETVSLDKQEPTAVPVNTQKIVAPSQKRMIMLHATNWEFAPASIMVKQGENVSLHLMSMEGSHGLAIPGLNINESIAPGQSKEIMIPTDTPGTYQFFCSVPCGAGHRDMKGTLIIE